MIIVRVLITITGPPTSSFDYYANLTHDYVKKMSETPFALGNIPQDRNNASGGIYNVIYYRHYEVPIYIYNIVHNI